MMKSAVDSYGYADDDILTDAISSFSTIGMAFGEIIGPIFAGTISYFLGIQACCALASLCNLIFAIVFIFVTGYAKDLFTTKPITQESILMNAKVAPETNIESKE